MLHIRGRLAPAKAEKLIVLKENLDLVEHFKENSLYKLQKSGGHNAFDVVEMEAFAGEVPLTIGGRGGAGALLGGFGGRAGRR